MKALSFRQPWAELVLRGQKTLDLRTYNSHFRGRFLIHAAQEIEREACAAHGLAADALPTGGLVGAVDLVDVTPLDEAAYEARRAEHLGGRSFRPGLFGWALAAPERLPALVPLDGRRRLFEVDERLVDDRRQMTADRRPPTADRPRTADAPPPPHRARPDYRADLNGTTPERPFALHVVARDDGPAAPDFSLMLRQRVAERPDAEPRLLTVATLGGDTLRAVADHVLEALRRAEYKPTDLSAARRKPFYLPEEAGVRLGLVFVAVRPLTKFRRIEEIAYRLRQMPAEEAYYWYSKCTAADTAERARQALRVLLAAE
mgnify:FL=1